MTEEDGRNGLATAIPEETRLLGFEGVPGQVGYFEVRLGPLQGVGTKQVDDLDKVAVAQIFFTASGLGQAYPVFGLRFTVAGRPVAVNTDRRTVGQNEFVRREDFSASSPPTTTTTSTTTTSTTTTTIVATTTVP